MQISKFLFLLIILTTGHQGIGQVLKVNGNISEEISSIIAEMPGNSGDDYLPPNANELNTWSTIMDNLLLGNYSEASDSAHSLEYDLIEFIDTTSVPEITYYILKTDTENYWGTYVYNPNYIRPLVIQSPHPKKDFNTGKQGIHIFKEVGALFFCLSGTSRCNSSSYSSCDGSTTSCSSISESYRISDLAHNTSTIFQQTTDNLFRYSEEVHFVQLHGFTKSSTDPYVIMSNGTQETPSPDFISIFGSNLKDQDNILTTEIAHVNLSWTRLRGFFNTQGRFINSSENVCNKNATTTEGRFIHLEQEKTRLRDNMSGWNKVANALKNTFTISTAVTDYEDSDKNFIIYPNPTSGLITLESNLSSINDMKLYNIIGQEIIVYNKLVNADTTKIVIDISNLNSGMYILRMDNIARVVYKH